MEEKTSCLNKTHPLHPSLTGPLSASSSICTTASTRKTPTLPIPRLCVGCCTITLNSGAIESLARIRKHARTTPALQVNIATDGGQQLNLLGRDPSDDD